MQAGDIICRRWKIKPNCRTTNCVAASRMFVPRDHNPFTSRGIMMNANTVPMGLSLISVEHGFALAQHGQPLQTKRGHVIQHQSEDLMRHILGDAASWEGATIENGVVTTSGSASALSFLRLCLDLTAPGGEPLMKDITQFLMADPMLHTIPGPEQISREATYGPVKMWLSDHLPALRKHAAELESQAFGPEETTLSLPLSPEAGQAIQFVQWLYNELSAEQRAVISALSMMHDRCLLLAMSLVVNPECDAREYAEGVIGALMLDPDVFTDATRKETKRVSDRLMRDAAQALEFLGMALADDDVELDDEE